MDKNLTGFPARGVSNWIIIILI